jgi:3-methyladenine DNA glycosylase AlkD
MKPGKLLKNIRRELIRSADAKTKASFQRFFKERVKCYGVKTPQVGKIAATFWKEAKRLEKKEIFAICEEFYKSDFTEEAFIVAMWLPHLIQQFTGADFKIFEAWIKKYINNWAKCDGFCNHTVGDFIEKYPEYTKNLKGWTKSPNRWLRRAAAVTLIVPAKSGKYLQDAFAISDLLKKDTDDLVQKGYGWLLKEESRKHPQEVFNYVYKNRAAMPRTALRYAIELLPPAMRLKAMEK